MSINVKSLVYSTLGAIDVITALAIFGELWKPLKLFLTDITGHHWITKGVFALGFFLIWYLISFKLNNGFLDIKRWTYYVVGAVIFCGLAIFAFFTIHYLNLWTN